MEEARIVLEVLRWVADAVGAFLAGEEGPEPKRLVEVLPDELRSDLEMARQRRLLGEELAADLAFDDDEEGEE
jgi:hypothetical protein